MITHPYDKDIQGQPVTELTVDKPPIDVPMVSLLPVVYSSESAKTVELARQSKAFLIAGTSNDTPYPSLTPTTVNSRAPTPTPSKNIDDQEDLPSCERLMMWRLASGFFALFVGGWADGVTGTVMPYLVVQFNLTSIPSSSLFAGTTCGYFAGTLLLEVFTKFLGRIHWNSSPRPHGDSDLQARHLLLIIASIIHALYFVMMGSRTGFPAMFMAYVFSAFSRALLTAPLNLYFASGPKQALGYGFGLASLGSVISPIVCQTIIATGVPWYRFYYGSLLLSAINLLFLGIAFKPTSNELITERYDNIACTSVLSTAYSVDSDPMEKDCFTIRTGERRQKDAKHSTLRRLLSLPYQWAISLFILLYCGSETTTQGFMVMYLLKTKHAHPRTIGYVTAGFWAGISLGRFIWGTCIPFLSFAQRKRIVHVCIIASVAVHLTIWFVNSYVENAIATSVIGILYGPVFPACLAMATDVLPRDFQMVAMALISSFASLGGAIFPLIAGAIFNAEGIKSLPYLTVPLAVTMACTWALFPSCIPSRSTVDGKGETV